jgi:hypothetical protein
MFWFDILNLTNGIFFLFLFKSMSLSEKPKRLKKGKLDEEFMNDRLLSSGSRPNHGTKSVIGILA